MFHVTSSTTVKTSAHHDRNHVNARHTFHERDAAARHELDRLMRAQADANAAIAAQNRALAHVHSDLISLPLIKRLQKGVQARVAAARAIAAALSPAKRGKRATPSRRAFAAARKAQQSAAHRASRRRRVAGGYANPLRSVSGLTPERVDAGVDYGGSGPVYAIGNGVVLNVYSGGWPNGVFIAYQLTDGPAKGLVVFTAEDLTPEVAVGASVTANTVIGRMFGGPHGIELGWADGSQIPNALARSYGQYHEGNSTAFGDNFSRLLQTLGAPGGILKNGPAGTLPAGWPQWQSQPRDPHVDKPKSGAPRSHSRRSNVRTRKGRRLESRRR
jgi:murein DD-endopeptidase MepM/ murein hydrolase activator NlpD